MSKGDRKAIKVISGWWIVNSAKEKTEYSRNSGFVARSSLKLVLI